MFEESRLARFVFGLTTREARVQQGAHAPWVPEVHWPTGNCLQLTIKEAAVKRLHYENYDQSRTYLPDFMAACRFARRLKTVGGLTPNEYIRIIWTTVPDRFTLDPVHQMPGLNT